MQSLEIKILPASIRAQFALTFHFEVCCAHYARPGRVGGALAGVVGRVDHAIQSAFGPGRQAPGQHGLHGLEVIRGGIRGQAAKWDQRVVARVAKLEANLSLSRLDAESLVVVTDLNAVLEPNDGAKRTALDSARGREVLLRLRHRAQIRRKALNERGGS